MDFFKSGLKTVLGAPEPVQQPSVSETVERLVDRVNNSTLLEDRRDACRALKAMSRTYRVEVGAQGMDTLKQVLELDRADNETINYALDTLKNIMSPSQFAEEEENPCVPMNIGEQFTEIFIKDPQNVQLILDLLDEFDFRVRLSAVQLLTYLLTNRPKDIQEITLVKPMGVSKMMDLLGDSREVIRNETLLLLIKLTKGNANIQKIVAFENAFDRLFEIVSGEGYSDGGIIVEDCLLLMLNLLKNNSSNINFFKEGSYIQKMLPMFHTPDDEDAGWTPQKVSNIHCMLHIVRTLVSPSNSPQIISSCQKIMKNVGLLDALCNILMSSGVPADILTETINTVGEVVRGDITNQEFLGNVMAPSNPPRPAIVVLLMSMVNEKQPFALRCAILYCFQCYLYHNEMSQASLVQTLLPSSSDVSTLTSGQLLCGGLFSSDVLSNWFSAVALMHGLIENPVQKEQLLRVLLATNIGSSPVSLLHQCALLLQSSTKLKPKVALLMLLSQWMSYCPSAVSAFLRATGGVGWLVSAVTHPGTDSDDADSLLQGLAAFLLAICVHFNDDSVENYTKESMKQLLSKRIGMETLVARLGEVPRHELHTKAAKHPQLQAKGPSDVLVDYEFCRLFKVLESVLIKSLTEQPEVATESLERAPSEGGALEQYKSLIRQQDARLQDLVTQLDGLMQQTQTLQGALNDSIAANSLLKDENTLLRAQVSARSATQIPPQSSANQDHRLQEYEMRIEELNNEVQRLNSELKISQETQKNAVEELDKLRKDQDDLLELLADQDLKLNEYKMRLISVGQNVEEDVSEPKQDAQLNEQPVQQFENTHEPQLAQQNTQHSLQNNQLPQTHAQQFQQFVETSQQHLQPSQHSAQFQQHPPTTQEHAPPLQQYMPSPQQFMQLQQQNAQLPEQQSSQLTQDAQASQQYMQMLQAASFNQKEVQLIQQQNEQYLVQNGQMLPQNNQIAPQNSQMLPQYSQMLPQNGQMIPQNSQMTSQNGQMTTEIGQVIPQNTQESSQSGQLPQNIQPLQEYSQSSLT